MTEKYEAVIGLEIHAQLLTDSKIFCGCPPVSGSEPNNNVCPVCLGFPGVLPVLNKKVVEYTVLMGLAVNCSINRRSVFARKNYFYPDLPKGYQISQYELPICENGYLEVKTASGGIKKIGITRIHMEEDAGKSIHDKGNGTLIDVNRCGVPLMEIVSEPDMRSAEEAVLYLSKIRQLVQYLGICDGNMEDGSLRCDANISIRLKGETGLGTKTEIKNMNSFRNVEKAINYEIERQIELIEDGEPVVQETLLWNADLNEAFTMRSKEDAHDYRYFPDPDLMPVNVHADWEKAIRTAMPELPDQKRKRFTEQYNLPTYDAEVLTQQKQIADYYEQVAGFTDDYKSASNWVMVDVLKILNEEKIDIAQFGITAESLAGLINLINDGTISGKIAKEIFPEMLTGSKSAAEIVKEKNLVQISDTGVIEDLINKILQAHPAEVEEYLSGKEKVAGFFIGKIMKETGGKANPGIVNKLIREKLNSLKNN